ncbi:hypothetical protein ABI_33640 [Asticcacaulis biprosthecium C19]|uniref:Uncharacterized protein n=1 Tax=Asticcacaulis biprosthecium C19 TaxID=715226 RepID=F4QQ59_9CAUL|nr:hypothetical protein [Asticcacaulis biprosthecium]EGF90346.1 hypothetical protein ABI_33640 [Asticcacaulis biprosthecium C19]
MSYRSASTTMFALLALVLIAVTAILVINMPQTSLAAPTVDTSTYYVPAADEPAVIDAHIEARQDA